VDGGKSEAHYLTLEDTEKLDVTVMVGIQNIICLATRLLARGGLINDLIIKLFLA
jgi:hypothetical protein